MLLLVGTPVCCKHTHMFDAYIEFGVHRSQNDNQTSFLPSSSVYNVSANAPTHLPYLARSLSLSMVSLSKQFQIVLLWADDNRITSTQFTNPNTLVCLSCVHSILSCNKHCNYFCKSAVAIVRFHRIYSVGV